MGTWWSVVKISRKRSRQDIEVLQLAVSRLRTRSGPSATTMAQGEATIAYKAPPPEKPEDIKTRGWVVFSFWAVVIFLGLPVWLWTTSIHRAALPLQQMLEWADGKV